MSASLAVRPKVAVQSATALVSSFVVWLLVTFVPSFHSGLPYDAKVAVPAAVGVVLGFVGGYLKKEFTKVQEVENVLDRAEAVATQVESVVNQTAQSAK